MVRKHVDIKYSNEEDVTSKVDYCDDLGLQTEPLIWLLYLITFCIISLYMVFSEKGCGQRTVTMRM
ncbi:hypothetical protein J6590_082222 [Homalodisca vitripennis]|nr:hypothetical protein J6590_082222 [Homalodisca vitripennis]